MIIVFKIIMYSDVYKFLDIYIDIGDSICLVVIVIVS